MIVLTYMLVISNDFFIHIASFVVHLACLKHCQMYFRSDKCIRFRKFQPGVDITGPDDAAHQK